MSRNGILEVTSLFLVISFNTPMMIFPMLTQICIRLCTCKWSSYIHMEYSTLISGYCELINFTLCARLHYVPDYGYVSRLSCKLNEEKFKNEVLTKLVVYTVYGTSSRSPLVKYQWNSLQGVYIIMTSSKIMNSNLGDRELQAARKRGSAIGKKLVRGQHTNCSMSIA